MFYAHFVLAKKGPLARIWLAAHWDKKLTKAHVFETNIESSVEDVLQPKVKMALRTSGHLLLGIVRIYSRKAKYLLADCNEAFIKIKMAFRPGVVDLPEGNREAAVATITLPEVFHDFDTAMPDITNIDVDATVTLNQSRAEDITLKEDYGNLNLISDDNFGDMGFDDPEMARDATNIDEGFDHASLLLGEDKNCMVKETSASSSRHLEEPRHDKKDDYAEQVEAGIMTGEGAGLFEPGGLFDDAPLGHVPLDTSVEPTVTTLIPTNDENRDDSDDDDIYDMGPASMGCPSNPSSPESPPPQGLLDGTAMQNNEEAPLILNAPEPERMLPPPLPLSDPLMPPPELPPPLPLGMHSDPMGSRDNHPPATDQTTLIHNEEESFALAPLDTTTIHVGGMERTKTKRKRKLIVDEVKNISGEEMKSQLSDTTDIVTTLDLAPPTKRLMHWKETGGVEKLFALPGRPMLSKSISKLYQRHLTTRSVENEDRNEEDRVERMDRMEHEEAERVSQEEENNNMQLQQQQQQQQVVIQNPPKRRKITANNNNNVMMPEDDTHLMSHQDQLIQHTMLQHPSLQDMDIQHARHHDQSADMTLLPPAMNSLQMQPDMSNNPLHLTMDPILIPMAMDSTLTHQLPIPSPRLPVNESLTDAFMFPQPEPQPMNISLDQSSVDQSTLPIIPPLETTPQPAEKVHQPLTPIPIMPEPIAMPSLPLPQQEPIQVVQDIAPAQEDINKDVVSEDDDDDHIHAAPFTPFNPQSVDPRDELFNQQLLDAENELAQDEINERQQQQQMEMNNNQNQMVYDDDDDYGAPASVGVPDEQGADETYEQFEERIINKRTVHMLHMIRDRMESHQTVRFSDLVCNNHRKQVAQKFYTFLVLKKQQVLELQQDEPYSELLITRGPKYNSMC